MGLNKARVEPTKRRRVICIKLDVLYTEEKKLEPRP